jgi:hypothetical protein
MVEAQARGLRIPEDLAVCGFGDADFAAHMEPSLTTVHVDGAAIGRDRRAPDRRPLRRQARAGARRRRGLPDRRARVDGKGR